MIALYSLQIYCKTYISLNKITVIFCKKLPGTKLTKIKALICHRTDCDFNNEQTHTAYYREHGIQEVKIP